MPFSFKPDIVQDEQAAQVAPPAVFASSTAAPVTLMERAKTEGTSLFGVLLFMVFGATALLTVGLFAYKYYLTSQVEAKKSILSQYEAQLTGIPLEEMRKVSNRMKVVNQLVKEHPSVNVAFLILEASIEHMLTLNTFDMHYSETSKSYQLNVGGIAPDYKAIAQQMDTYARKPYSTYVSKVTVDNLYPNDSGQVLASFIMPVSIMGLVPETFSLIDGAADAAASFSPEDSSAFASTTQATTTMVGAEGAVSVGTTTPPAKP